MRAVRLHAPGGADRLELDTVPVPDLGATEVLLRVHAAAITRDELEWPVDRLPAIPSYEVSGVVVNVADGVDDLAVGDEVYGLTPFDRDGAAAEYVAVPTGLVTARPRSMTHVESAAVPLPALSAWQGLLDHGGLADGERVLIHGAAGGVGHFATQLARSPSVLRDGGRLVSVAEEPPPPPSRITATYFVVEPSREQLLELTRLVDEGKLVAAVDSVFPLADARSAFERVQEAGKHGKVVLQVHE
jgi:NADPH:quinone reductase-like Zn-dependent oxidoreductase